MKPLWGHKMVVTRSRQGARELAQILAKEGAEVFYLPLTKQIAGDTQALSSALAKLVEGQFDWLLLASHHAVRWVFDEVVREHCDTRALAGIRIACVGNKTARALAPYGVLAEVVPERQDALGLAQAVLNAGPSGARCLVARARGGRDEAIAALTAGGATVWVVDAYQSVALPADDPLAERASQLLRAQQVSACGFFAPSQVHGFFARFGGEAAGMLRRALVAAIGNTTAQALEEHEVANIVVADRPSEEGLARAIVNALVVGDNC